MTLLRRIELICGITTFLLATVVTGTIAQPRSPAEFLRLLTFYLGPALLVAVGSYRDAVRQKASGLVTLLVGGSILTLMLVGLIFGGAVFYFYGLWGGLLGLSPSAMAILTIVASLLARLFGTHKESF